ncbi:RNA recognition motif domain-containing protein [Ditylenchus destructor]|uniref:RNA-binding protein 8A n=1 Tax=Ditylenchus destructor TaxID=166010 RepID=A0AAD4NFC1_9BILA|nr:RNA recognition motif domain-containing protein [Ditylenchus destructor]
MSAEDSIVLDEAMDDGTADIDLDELKKGVAKKKGRGFGDAGGEKRAVKQYDALDDDGQGGPQRSVEGWIILVTNVHEEAQEDEVKDVFKEYGNVMNMHLNLDRRTGYFKGYAIVQYETQQEAADAIAGLNDYNFLGQTLSADWCFVKGGREKKR